jgi:hypothetical protein
MINILFLSLILSLVCFNSVMAAETQITQQIELGVNKQKTVTADKLTIKFLSVIEDSRCPVGVDCIWSGNAKVQIKVTNRKGVSKTFELNTDLEPQAVNVEGYEIRLAGLRPHPRANIRIQPNRYTATFTLTK